jgi:hypothetical protein
LNPLRFLDVVSRMNLKSVWTCASLVAFVLGATNVVAGPTAPALAQVKPAYVPDEVIVSYVIDLMPGTRPPTAMSLDQMFAAAGVTVVSDQALSPPEVVEHLAVVRLNPGTRWGQAFRTMQTFDPGVGSRWSLRYLQPNFLYFIDAPPGASRVFNFSTRTEVRTGESATIGGLVVPGEFARLVVIKVRGPSLAAFGVSQPLANPKARLYAGGTLLLENDDWGSLRSWEQDLARSLCPPPNHPREAMLVTYLDPGIYTAVVEAADGKPGVALLEMHLLDQFIVQ